MTRAMRALACLGVAIAVLSCSSGGSGGVAPDAGSGGNSGSGGTGGGVKHSVSAKVSDCRTGGSIKYTTAAGTIEKQSASLTVPEGDTVTFEAAPDPQSVFLGWTGDCSGTADCTLTVDAPKSVVADFGPKASTAQAWEFTASEFPAYPSAPALGPSGQVAVSVSFTGKADLGAGNFLEAAGGLAIVVYEADGSMRWSKLFPYKVWEVRAMRWVGADLVVVGTRLKAWTMDGVTLDGKGHDAMVARLDGATGAVKVAENATPQSSEDVRLAAISASGRVAVVGDFGGTINLGGSDLAADTAKSTNEFVASFDASFTHQWSAAMRGDNSFSETRGLDVDDAGRVALGGSVEAVMELPGQTLSNPSSSESPFVALFGASGSLSFAKVYEIASGSNQTDGVHFDDGGDLLVAMHVSKTVDLGAGALDATSNSTGSSDLVLARLSASGSVVWNRRLATEGFEYNFRLAGEGSTMTVLGEYSAQNKDVDFGTGVVHSSDNFDVILAQFSAQDGATEWVRSFGCTEWDRPAEVTAVGNRACFIGSFKVSLDYGGTAPLTFAKAFSPLVCLTP